MGPNKIIIAAAGSGKTTHLVKTALELDDTILITTYTQANEREIRKKFIELNKCIPSNVFIQTWFSFLLEHGVRPYQSYLLADEIKGFILVNARSAQYVSEANILKHYLSDNRQIYSDKVAKFIIRCNKKSNGRIIYRLERIYSNIFLDEVQDLAGYDLEILKLLFSSKINLIAVCDPRQSTYSTNSSSKNIQFKKSLIVNFFMENEEIISIDTSSLIINHRCTDKICNLSNQLFTDFPQITSGNSTNTGHDGVFLVHSESIDNYLSKYKPMQLRDSKRTNVSPNYGVINFGESKGLSFDRILIYPTKPFCNWLEDHNTDLAQISRSKLYVALTRARQSVGIVYNYDDKTKIDFTEKYFDE